MKSLLLSGEFADVPDILRDNLQQEPLLLEGYQEPLQTSTQENEQRIVELSAKHDPAECWAIDYQGPDIWRATGAVPIGNDSVVARTNNNDTFIERIFTYENADAPRALLDNIADRLNKCAEFTMSNSLGAFSRTVIDRSSELGLPDTIVFSNNIDGWFVYSYADKLLMTFFIQKGSTIDPPALIAQAVSKFRDGSKR